MGTERECIRWEKVGKGGGKGAKRWGRKGVGRRGCRRGRWLHDRRVRTGSPDISFHCNSCSSHFET